MLLSLLIFGMIENFFYYLGHQNANLQIYCFKIDKNKISSPLSISHKNTSLLLHTPIVSIFYQDNKSYKTTGLTKTYVCINIHCKFKDDLPKNPQPFLIRGGISLIYIPRYVSCIMNKQYTKLLTGFRFTCFVW